MEADTLAVDFDRVAVDDGSGASHVGEEWTGHIEQKPEVIEMAKNGLVYADLYHSVRDKPARTRITIQDS